MATTNRGGRPATAFTDEQVDAAKQELGKRLYRSRAATALARKFKLGRDTAYRLLDLAQERVYESLRADGRADDPLTAVYMFLVSVLADPKVRTRDKIAAAGVIIELLGLHKLAEQLGADDADRILADILQRQLAAKQRAAAEENPAERNGPPGPTTRSPQICRGHDPPAGGEE